MKENQQATPDEIKVISEHLDALLGMDVRKPGTAATLPAVIRITETLEPAGGKDFPVFPPSYAGEGTNAPPVYDLNGIEWGEVLRESAKDGTKRFTRYVRRARHCTMDSPQSQANRTEIAFRDDSELRALVPQAEAKIPRKLELDDQAKTNLLALPHRVADFRVRASNQKNEAAAAIKAFAKGDALLLLRLMPTSIVFGFWDSRAEGYQHKHARVLLTRIDAFGVVPCERHSVYTGPYSKDECAAVVLGNENLAQELKEDDEQTKAGKEARKEAEEWADRMAKRGFSNALDAGLGGVFAERIERLALISLTDIASIYCFKTEETAAGASPDSESLKNREPDKELTNAARRYLLALSLLAENYPRSTGSYRLRSGCELLPVKQERAILGSGNNSEHVNALKELCGNRESLIAVARAAHEILKIPVDLPLFESDKNSLKSDLEQGKTKKADKVAKPKQGAKAPPASGEPEAKNQAN
ncbi:MAG TPA: type I-U CRISPR-associated RAMP protein Csb1/Cas7u [Bryobacteraceae bacterium]|jgi:CRISPR-associated protein Csb1|nr:type I-U CRISPR-associated RAMP protein Csb1/Cas7u [Bryobacteraceae bacterium]